jgi:hypothetical protein
MEFMKLLQIIDAFNDMKLAFPEVTEHVLAEDEFAVVPLAQAVHAAVMPLKYVVFPHVA